MDETADFLESSGYHHFEYRTCWTERDANNKPITIDKSKITVYRRYSKADNSAIGGYPYLRFSIICK